MEEKKKSEDKSVKKESNVLDKKLSIEKNHLGLNQLKKQYLVKPKSIR